MTEKIGADSFDEFVGQHKTVERLRVHIRAADAEDRLLEHTLLCGPPGTGKTTLAEIVAHEAGMPLAVVTLPANERQLLRLLSSHIGMVFIDELHAASTKTQEILQPLLLDGTISLRSGGTRSNELLTVVAATTKRQKIIEPLYDRFVIKPAIEPYTNEELGQIVQLMARKARVDFTTETAEALGRAAGGVPRNAQSMVLAARALRHNLGRDPSVPEILDFCQTTAEGLEPLHVEYLQVLSRMEGQSGLRKLSQMLHFDPGIVEQSERLLFDLDYISFGDRGRELTPAGEQRLKELT